ncbi:MULTISPECIES: signal peptidase I [Plantibacter]|uniref:signal peptidase I n=1 Tax=Plantibacter TaxID=190323 RepID=UPI00193091BF|nr:MULTISPECIES: signal peptidase I [Plantibacter]MBD8535775.1 signal peptidase I [Plantibacter sp. CFBP 13570]CAH0239023.1 hypothetical protein SRABI02_02883 [Plantibacter cousiniae]
MEPSSARRRIVSSVIVVVALGARVLALLALCLLAWAAVPKLVGWVPTTVASGSMEPRIRTGDVVVSMPIDGADAAAGQVVLVDGPGEDDALLLHRVFEREAEGLRLKGDANRQPDRQLVQDDAVRGVGVLRVPYIGLPVVWAHEGRWAELALLAPSAAATGCAIVWTRRFLVDERGRTTSRGRLQAMGPVGGVALAGVLAIAAVVPTAGASWTSAADSSGNHLGTEVFSCLGQPLGAPEMWFDFNEPSGTALVNAGSGPGFAFISNEAVRVDGVCGDGPFARLDGVGTQVTTMPQVSSPRTFSLETWFRTTRPQGKLIGFGVAQTVGSWKADRHLYIGPDGRLVFGVQSGSPEVVMSPEPVVDGEWHHVVAVMSESSGMELYLDGELVASNPSTGSTNYRGYWRIGFDNVTAGWPNAPTSPWFGGDLDAVGVHLRALSVEEVADHAAAGRP